MRNSRFVCFKGKRFAFIMTFLIFIGCLATGCQPTPEEPPIVNKADGGLDKKISETAQSAQKYEVPQSWQETLDMKGSKIKAGIDAVISVPDVERFPVLIMAPDNFTQQRVDALMACFVKDKKVVIPPQRTKADLEKMLIDAKRGQLIDGQYIVNEGSKAVVKQLEEMIRNAPETSEKKDVTDFTIKADGTGFSGRLELGGDQYGIISASARNFTFANGFVLPESQWESDNIKDAGEIQITKEKAVAAAQEALKEFGIQNMAPVDIEKGQLFAQKGLIIDDVPEKVFISKGYYMEFAFGFGGLETVLLKGGSMGKNETFAYCAPIKPERISMYVDENGQVQMFSWSAPLKMPETMTDNAPLMSFEKMQERIRKQVFYKCSFMDNVDNFSVTVKKIEMKLSVIPVMDKTDEYMYVPAWYITYTQKWAGDAIDDTGKRITERTDDDLIVLNAIDGGAINPSPYHK
ncbi:MAG: DUF6034 family protein [Christensenellales bacterium]